jgi:hypothetical protein
MGLLHCLLSGQTGQRTMKRTTKGTVKILASFVLLVKTVRTSKLVRTLLPILRLRRVSPSYRSTKKTLRQRTMNAYNDGMILSFCQVCSSGDISINSPFTTIFPSILLLFLHPSTNRHSCDTKTKTHTLMIIRGQNLLSQAALSFMLLQQHSCLSPAGPEKPPKIKIPQTVQKFM